MKLLVSSLSCAILYATVIYPVLFHVTITWCAYTWCDAFHRLASDYDISIWCPLYIRLGENGLFADEKLFILINIESVVFSWKMPKTKVLKHWRVIWEIIFATCNNCMTQTRWPIVTHKSIDMYDFNCKMSTVVNLALLIESIKTTSMEDVSIRVLEKIKNI